MQSGFLPVEANGLMDACYMTSRMSISDKKLSLAFRECGFTLIELILTVVLLGVISAYAINRVANLQDEAFGAAFENAYDAFSNGQDIYRMQWQVDLQPAVGSVISGFASPVSSGGYPVETGYAGTATAIGCRSIWEDLLNPAPESITLTNFAVSYQSIDLSKINFVVTSLGNSQCAFVHVSGATGKGDQVDRILYDMDTGLITKDLFELP